MVNDTVSYTSESARLAGGYLFGGLLIVAVVIFSLLVWSNVYFNAVTYKLSVGVSAVSWLLFFALLLRGKFRASENDDIKAKSAAAPFILAVLYAPMILYAFLSLLVFLTSKEQIQISTRIYATGGGRGCRMYYEFNNAPIDRSVSVCHDKLFWPTKSGDTAIVSEQIGPLGARVQSIEHHP